jgi:hypothetical protein
MPSIPLPLLSRTTPVTCLSWADAINELNWNAKNKRKKTVLHFTKNAGACAEGFLAIEQSIL